MSKEMEEINQWLQLKMPFAKDRHELIDKIESLLARSEAEQEEVYSNMQYYMEHCRREGYCTPHEWIEKHKHF